ncbi:DUF3107 domain-containing protein [Enemella sp. A6]|uniref:DUF3107 domain-containing protein n=1 Tax=Enemella sp. A6 TaxID=3440152 RepID=UPI003EB87215
MPPTDSNNKGVTPVEIKVGIRQVAREVVLETDESSETVQSAFAKAVSDSGVLTLTDTHGRVVLVPAEAIGYLEIGQEHARRVGFGMA